MTRARPDDRIRRLAFDDTAYQYHNDVWALGLAGGGTWTQLTPTGTKPAIRGGHGAFFDAPRNRMVVFSGASYDTLGNYVVFNGHVGARLHRLPALDRDRADEPARRHGARRDRVRLVPAAARVVRGMYTLVDEVWKLNMTGGPAWTQIVPANKVPQRRSDHGAAYDRPGHRMLIYGGASQAGWALDDVWAFRAQQRRLDPGRCDRQCARPHVCGDGARFRAQSPDRDVWLRRALVVQRHARAVARRHADVDAAESFGHAAVAPH